MLDWHKFALVTIINGVYMHLTLANRSLKHITAKDSFHMLFVGHNSLFRNDALVVHTVLIAVVHFALKKTSVVCHEKSCVPGRPRRKNIHLHEHGADREIFF